MLAVVADHVIGGVREAALPVSHGQGSLDNCDVRKFIIIFSELLQYSRYNSPIWDEKGWTEVSSPLFILTLEQPQTSLRLSTTTAPIP